MRQQPLLAAADANVALARAQIGEAVAPGLPQASATYLATREKRSLQQLLEGLPITLKGPQGTVIATVNPTSTFTYQAGQFVLSQLLFDFGRVLLARRAAIAEFRAAGDDRERVKQAVVLTVKQTYFDLLVARRLLLVAQDTLRRSNLNLKTATSRFDSGLAPRFDVVRQELQVAAAELEVKTATGNIELARENLRDAMGLSEPITFDPDDAALVPVTVAIDEDQALAMAFAQRPELHGVALQREAQTARIDALARSYLPVATGHADYLFSGDRQPGPQEGWAVGALVRLPIFDGGLTPARLSEARAQLMALDATERQLRQQVTLQVRESLVNLRRAEDSVPVSNKTVDVAREALRISETRYSNGVAGILELVNSQLALGVASANHAQLLADGQIALAQLEHAVNGPLEPSSGGKAGRTARAGAAARARPAAAAARPPADPVLDAMPLPDDDGVAAAAGTAGARDTVP